MGALCPCPHRSNLSSPGSLGLFHFKTWARVGRLRRGGDCIWRPVWVEDGMCDSRQVVLFRSELFRLPRVGEGLGVQLWVTDSFLELIVLKRAMDGGVEGVVRRGGRGLA